MKNKKTLIFMLSFAMLSSSSGYAKPSRASLALNAAAVMASKAAGNAIGTSLSKSVSAPTPQTSAAPVAVTQPVADKPTVPAAVVQQPVAQEPVVQQPVVQQPVAQEPVVQQPVVQQPVVQQPVVQQPVVQQASIPSAANVSEMDALKGWINVGDGYFINRLTNTLFSGITNQAFDISSNKQVATPNFDPNTGTFYDKSGLYYFNVATRQFGKVNVRSVSAPTQANLRQNDGSDTSQDFVGPQNFEAAAEDQMPVTSEGMPAVENDSQKGTDVASALLGTALLAGGAAAAYKNKAAITKALRAAPAKAKNFTKSSFTSASDWLKRIVSKAR